MTEENPFKVPPIGAQIDPSAHRDGFACYEIRDQADSVLARIVVSNDAHPAGGAEARTEYWQINGTQLVMSGESYKVVRVKEDRWHLKQPTFHPKHADFSCPVDKLWEESSSEASYYKSSQTLTGFFIDVRYTDGAWVGSMDFYRPMGDLDLMFGRSPENSFSKQTDTSPRRHVSITKAEMTTLNKRLISGSTYTLKDNEDHEYLCNSTKKSSSGKVWVMTSSQQAQAQAHTFEKKKGEGAIKSGDTVYIKATQSECPGSYLRADLEQTGDENDAYYESGNDPVAVHEWTIRKSPDMPEDPYIRVGDHVTLMNGVEADKRYLAANIGDAFVSVTPGRTWTVG